MTAKPKLLSQSHQALLQSDPEMKFPSKLHSKLPKKRSPKRPHQQRVSKLLQNRMTAKPKLLSQSHQALLQSDPEIKFPSRPSKKVFPKQTSPTKKMGVKAASQRNETSFHNPITAESCSMPHGILRAKGFMHATIFQFLTVPVLGPKKDCKNIAVLAGPRL